MLMRNDYVGYHRRNVGVLIVQITQVVLQEVCIRIITLRSINENIRCALPNEISVRSLKCEFAWILRIELVSHS